MTQPQNARIVIAIDGPAASGKGSIARALAEYYALAHLDTGLLYRAVGVLALQQPDVNPIEIAQTLRAQDLLHTALRGREAAINASKMAAIPEVRHALTAFQRGFAQMPPDLPNGQAAKGAILDGRDIGTVILPDARLKLYVTARPEIRAQRRLLELSQKDPNLTYETVFADVKARDERDAQRKEAPMRPAEDALLLDTSELDIQMAVAQVKAVIEARFSVV